MSGETHSRQCFSAHVGGEFVAQHLRCANGGPDPHRLSTLALASLCPSGLNATPVTVSVWPVRGAPSWPVSAFHNRTVLSSPALASRCPSGLNATPHRAGVAGQGGADGLAGVGVPQPHRVVVAGAGQPVPVGAERHTVTAPVWPVRGAPIGSPVSGFHNRTVLSPPALASRRPSGLNATPYTTSVWPVSGAPKVRRCRGSTTAPSGRRRRWPAGARRG